MNEPLPSLLDVHAMPRKQHHKTTTTGRSAAAATPAAEYADTFRRALVLLAQLVPSHVRLFMMLTTSTRAEFWVPRNLAMTVAVGRSVCTADNTRRSVVHSAVALMWHRKAMCLHIRLQRNAILFFAHVASRASLQCVRTLPIRVEHWGELDAAAKLLLPSCCCI
eukprot:271563-Rhodomonas_salina.1